MADARLATNPYTLGEYRKCHNCGDYGYFGGNMSQHRCHPAWQARGAWEDWPDAEWADVHARDAESAAERYAEEYDSEGGEYTILSGRNRSPTIIYVRKEPDDDSYDIPNVEMFSIEAEAVPTYTGTKVERVPQ